MSKDNETHTPKVCPVCRHVFQGIGWTGIDAHWRAQHISQVTINPTQVVPLGPLLDFTRPHKRDRLKAAAS